MAKDSYWFRHDCTAGRGSRLRRIQFIYNHWGKGVYWDVIEYLRDQQEYKAPKDEFSLKMICDVIGCKDEPKFKSWFNDCIKYDLLQSDEMYFWSDVLCKNMGVWETKKHNGSQGGRPKKNRIKTETITESKANHKANQNHNIIEYNRIDIYKGFLDSGIWLEQCCMKLGCNKNQLQNHISKFLIDCELKKELKELDEMQKYFVNWVKYNPIQVNTGRNYHSGLEAN